MFVIALLPVVFTQVKVYDLSIKICFDCIFLFVITYPEGCYNTIIYILEYWCIICTDYSDISVFLSNADCSCGLLVFYHINIVR